MHLTYVALHEVTQCMVKTVAVSCGTSPASSASTPHQWCSKTRYEKLFTHRITCEHSESARERRIVLYKKSNQQQWQLRVQGPCESRGGHPGLPVLMNLTVSVDVKQHWTVHTHGSQFVPNMSTWHPRTLSCTSPAMAEVQQVDSWTVRHTEWCTAHTDMARPTLVLLLILLDLEVVAFLGELLNKSPVWSFTPADTSDSTHICVCTCVCVCACAYMHVCVHISVHMHIILSVYVSVVCKRWQKRLFFSPV